VVRNSLKLVQKRIALCGSDPEAGPGAGAHERLIKRLKEALWYEDQRVHCKLVITFGSYNVLLDITLLLAPTTKNVIS
jgi:hypothetical protein